MKFTTRELVLMAVFGTLWGIVEITLGSVLKSLNLPLSGVILSALGLTIAMVGRLFIPKRGSTLFIGVIATLLKLFSLGSVLIGPMIGILSEALIAEAVLSLRETPSRMLFLLAGSFGVLWSLAQPFVTGPLLFSRSLFTVWLDLLDLGNRLLGLPANAALIIVVLLAGFHLLIGGIAGWIAWNIGQRLETRMG